MWAAWPSRPRPAQSGQPAKKKKGKGTVRASFLFLYFLKIFFTEIYFQFHNLQSYTPTARQGGGRGPTARQVGGRDLYVNKNNFFFAEVLGGSLPSTYRAAGPLPPTGGAVGGLPPGRGAAGSLLKYKTPTLLSAPSFSAHEIQRGERER